MAVRKLLLLNGPNLDMLGMREPEIYGTETLEAIEQAVRTYAEKRGIELTCYQSNSESRLIKRIHTAQGCFDGVVYNPGAHTHYSYALRDAISSIDVPFVEVHLSDIDGREPFRRVSVIAPVCVAQVKGLGANGYCRAIDVLLENDDLPRLGEGFEGRFVESARVLVAGQWTAVPQPAAAEAPQAVAAEGGNGQLAGKPAEAPGAQADGAEEEPLSRALGALLGAAAGNVSIFNMDGTVEESPEDAPEGMAEANSEGAPAESPEGAPEGSSEGALEEAPEEMLDEMPDGQVAEESEEAPGEMPDGQPDAAPEEAADEQVDADAQAEPDGEADAEGQGPTIGDAVDEGAEPQADGPSDSQAAELQAAEPQADDPSEPNNDEPLSAGLSADLSAEEGESMIETPINEAAEPTAASEAAEPAAASDEAAEPAAASEPSDLTAPFADAIAQIDAGLLSYERQSVVRAICGKMGLAAMLVRDTSNIRWITAFDGAFDTEQAHSLLVGADRTVLHTDSRYANAMRTAASSVNSDVVIDDSQLSHMEFARAALVPEGQETLEGRLGIEDTITYAEFVKAVNAFSTQGLAPTTDVVLGLRSVKDTVEVVKMRAAQAIADAAFRHIVSFMKPGMTEREVQIELDSYMLRHGAEGLAFPSIVACGENGADPHAVPSNKQLEAGQCVVMDFGARALGYCSDMTRTVFLGQPEGDMARAWEAVRQANETAELMLRPGVTGRSVHEAAENVLAECGFAGKMGHGLGHGVGIDCHELPLLNSRYESPLIEGNVVTVEPGVYLPGQFGIRLEDCGVITANGYEVFSRLGHEPVVL